MNKMMPVLFALLLLGLSACKKVPEPPSMKMELSFNGEKWHSCPVRIVSLGSRGYFRITCKKHTTQDMSLLFDQYISKAKLWELEKISVGSSYVVAPTGVQKAFPNKGLASASYSLLSPNATSGKTKCKPLAVSKVKKVDAKIAYIKGVKGKWPTFGTYRLALHKPCGVLTVKLSKNPGGKTEYYPWSSMNRRW
ncbi:MAG: hypothetical protein EP343_12970 [Deltaproteobacteria bacterium]|nr:MAG: hypothetical protein EP343_12970 [Deltaproteobacteria bacterium]